MTDAEPSRYHLGHFLLSVFILAGLFAGVYFVVMMSGPWSLLYHFEGRFESLPPTDEPLIAAIRETARVIDHSVYVERLKEPGAIRITFGTGGSLWNRPPLPDLDKLCAKFGYEEPKGGFRQVP
jgi:hypothetical protein